MYNHITSYRSEISGTRKIPLSHELLRTLLYFEIFHFPLTEKELRRFCGLSVTYNEIEYELRLLEKLGYIKCKEEFYCTAGENIDAIVERRIRGHKKAEKMLIKAGKYSKLISYFPFVRGIYLSGSLSKGYADEQSDVDYFIITEPGRLWLCRTLLILFKRVFLLNSHKYFCVNYFVDTQNLEIEDKNIFTATELTTLIPTCNTYLYRKLMQANPWVKDFFPNTMLESVSGEEIGANTFWLKRFAEAIFLPRFSDKLDEFCYRITVNAWKRKFKNFSDWEFELNLRSKKNVSKHHPRGFQIRVIKEFAEKMKDFERRFQIKLS